MHSKVGSHVVTCYPSGQRAAEEGFGKGNLPLVDELIANNHVRHSDNVVGREEYKEFIAL